MRKIPIEAVVQGGVFTTQQALRAGWTIAQLKYAVHVGQLVRPRRGTYAADPKTSGLWPARSNCGSSSSEARPLRYASESP
jgi:hypothetical protein